MIYTNSAGSIVKNNRKQTQASLRFQREHRSNTSPPPPLGPTLRLTQSGERRVRVNQERNLLRDLFLLGIAFGIPAWAFEFFLF